MSVTHVKPSLTLYIMLSKPLGLIALLLERDAETSHENSSRITANEA